MPSKLRLQRIADRIRQELSSMIVRNEVHDPRLYGINITDVMVDRELAYCDIYVSALEGIERQKDVLAGLTSATGFLRTALADRVELRAFPRLRFHWDPTPEHADHMEKLFASIRQAPPPVEPAEEEGEEEQDA